MRGDSFMDSTACPAGSGAGADPHSDLGGDFEWTEAGAGGKGGRRERLPSGRDREPRFAEPVHQVLDELGLDQPLRKLGPRGSGDVGLQKQQLL
jgi:hypothetical protein